MKGLLKIVSLTFLFLLAGCANYYYLGGQQKVETDKPYQYNKFVLSFDKRQQKLDFYTYADYVFNKIEPEYIFFKNPEMKRLLRYRMTQKPTEQMLFMYTFQPTFSNILGFYYKGLTTADVKKKYGNSSQKQIDNQLLFQYSFEKFSVFDFYKDVEGGVIRFVALNNPDYSQDPESKSFSREIDKIFFDANTFLKGGTIERLN
ncbi:hypothetical protein [Flavobacterium sp.]|uniref:hypothetical protein n=1 Tax=Flavobacterium sp. TaxID=239 RepID=UPI0026154A5F|nr:hypothetical protein [Flavobacterium sp.]